MNRVRRLEPIKELAERKERQAAQTFGQSQQILEAARKGLTSLHEFRQNYSEQFQASATQGLGIRRLQEYRAFLDKINKAIVDQEKRVQQAEREVDNKKRNWEAARAHLLGLQTVVDKLRGEALKQDQKREQSEQDDRAGRRSGDKTLLSLFL